MHVTMSAAVRIVFIFSTWCLTAAAGLTDSVRAITFADLPDPQAQAFDDPFRAMGYDMLEELRAVVRLEERLAAGTVPAEARPRLEAKLASSRAALAEAGYDIQDLLAARWSVAERRRVARFSTNPALEGSTVTLSGYIIPAGTAASGKPVGYLVPEVGMCSHKPPPPPNQLILVEMTEGDTVETIYTPVQVTGRLQAHEHDATVFILDGKVRMVGRWALALDAITVLGPDAGSAPFQGRIDPLAVD